jgi:hypothetical protein
VAEFSPSQRQHDRALLAIGAICAGGGLYFVLAGFGLAPPPGKINGPVWLSACLGLVFLAGGVMVLVRGWLAVPDAQRELPEDAPRALIALQWIATVAALPPPPPGSLSAQARAISSCRSRPPARSAKPSGASRSG